MKWNGIVSQPGASIMATRFATANAPHASSIGLRRSNAITRMANCLDRRLVAELLAQAANADVDHVRTGIEVIAPDLGEQPLAADHLARMLAAGGAGRGTRDPRGRRRRSPSRASRRARSRIERPRADDARVVLVPGLAQLHADARDELVEGERLARRSRPRRARSRAASSAGPSAPRRSPPAAPGAPRCSSRSTLRPSIPGSSRSSTTRS